MSRIPVFSSQINAVFSLKPLVAVPPTSPRSLIEVTREYEPPNVPKFSIVPFSQRKAFDKFDYQKAKQLWYDFFMSDIADNYIDEGLEKGMVLGLEKGKAEGEAQGIAKGKVEGIAERNIEIARRMIKENVDIKFISSVTDLSTDELLKLKNRI